MVTVIAPLVVLAALGAMSWTVGTAQGRGVVAAAAGWLLGSTRTVLAWMVGLFTGRSAVPVLVPLAPGKAASPGKPVTAPGKGNSSPPRGATVRVGGRHAIRRPLFPVKFPPFWGWKRGRGNGGEAGSPPPPASPPPAPRSPVPPPPPNGRTDSGGESGGGETVTVSTTITRTTRTTTPRDYTPHAAGDSGAQTTRQSLRSHTVYGQTLAMIPAATGTVAGYAALIRRHRDEASTHGIQGHVLDAWDIAVQCAAAAEAAAEEAAGSPDDPGLRATAARALTAAVEAVRDAAQLQVVSLEDLFTASDGSVAFLLPAVPLSGLRAAA